MYDAVLSAKYGRNQYESMLANRGCLPKDPFVFSCFHDYFEDYGTTQFLMNELKSACPEADTRFLSFYDMKIDDDGIPLADGSHATLLYRLHPMELLIDEQTPDDEPLGEMFLDLYEENTFALFNPPESIILQNKSFMSLVYALYLTDQFLQNQIEISSSVIWHHPILKMIFQLLMMAFIFKRRFGAVKEGMYKLFKSVVIHLSFTWKS